MPPAPEGLWVVNSGQPLGLLVEKLALENLERLPWVELRVPLVQQAPPEPEQP